MSEKKGFMHRITSQYQKVVQRDEYYVRKEVMKAFNPLLGWVGEGLQVRSLASVATSLNDPDREGLPGDHFFPLPYGVGSLNYESDLCWCRQR